MIEIDAKRISEAAVEIRVPEAFLEKEIHAVNVVNIVSSISFSEAFLVFSGGTSLSTAHNLIERFSEDLDFKLVSEKKEPVSHEIVTAFCKLASAALREAGYTLINQQEKPEFCFKRILFTYGPQFDLPSPIRPHLQIDTSGEGGIKEDQTICTVSPLLKRKFDHGEHVTDVPCVSPIEIVADKVSSLTWRVIDGRVSTEPEMMRHLYDIHCLLAVIEESPAKFRNLSCGIILEDVSSRTSSYSNKDHPFAHDHVDSAVKLLRSQPIHFDAYKEYVLPTIYGDKPQYDDAVASLDVVIDVLQA